MAGFNLERCWTTAVNARIFRLSSGIQVKRPINTSRVLTAGNEIQSLLFQIAASKAHMKMSDSGEECVLIATK